MSSNIVMHVYPHTTMQYGHKGLAEVAMKTNKLDVYKLRVGQFALFINNAFTAVKLFGANGVLVHYKHPKNHILDYKALRLIPLFFDGQDIGYTKALSRVIRDEYPHLFEE